MKLARFQWQGKVNWGIVEGDIIFALVGDLYGDFTKGKELCRLPDVRLLAPVEPRITIACGLNYMDHIKELDFEVPKVPALFYKPVTTVVNPGDNIVYPAISHDLRCEGELCVVIKHQAKNVTEEVAMDYILGYTCGNDVTAVDLTEIDGRLTRSKGFDTSGPLGPFLVTGLDPSNLNIKVWVNGEKKQDGTTSSMLFGIKKLISYISAFITLRPGDVIWTGTPGGGLFPVKVGDIIAVEVEGIGVLQNKLVAPE